MEIAVFFGNVDIIFSNKYVPSQRGHEIDSVRKTDATL